MRPEELFRLIRIKPFAPLRIHMTDGRAFDVTHSDQIIVLRSRVIIGVEPDRDTGVVRRVEHCSLLHVVRVEQLQPS